MARPPLLEQSCILSGVGSNVRQNRESNKGARDETLGVESEVPGIPIVDFRSRVDDQWSSVFRPP